MSLETLLLDLVETTRQMSCFDFFTTMGKEREKVRNHSKLMTNRELTLWACQWILPWQHCQHAKGRHDLLGFENKYKTTKGKESHLFA